MKRLVSKATSRSNRKVEVGKQKVDVQLHHMRVRVFGAFQAFENGLVTRRRGIMAPDILKLRNRPHKTMQSGFFASTKRMCAESQ